MVVKSSYPSVLKQHAVVYCLFFADVFIKLLELHQPYETHNIRPRPTISSPDLQYQARTFDIKPRPTISGPHLRYQAPTYNIRPRPTISGPQIKQRFRACSKRFSRRTASKIHEYFDQQMGLNYFSPNCVLFHSQFVKYS